MSDATATAALAAQQSQETDLVALKQQVDRLRGDITPGQTKQQKLRKACTDFEAVFISKMWEKMRNTIPKDGILHSQQEDMYRSMFDRDFSEKLARDGGIGLGDMLYGQLKDKLKGAGKANGATSLENTAKTTGIALERPELKQPTRPGQGIANPETKASATSQATTTVQAATTTTKTAATAAPERPASVPGEIMAQVENLARRIEEQFDKRLQSLTQSTQSATQSSSQSSTSQTSTQGASQTVTKASAKTNGYTLGARISALGIPLGRNLATRG